MEQSVATPHRFKKPATFLVVLLTLWLLPALAILQLSRSYNHSLAQIEELGIRVTELRQSLYFSEPLRVSRINDLALDAQLVYSIRLQIESDFQHTFFRPDVNQLLYVVDQFLEKFDEFIPIESQVQDLVDNIKILRADTGLYPELKPLLNELGVVVFEAMYSDTHSSSATYRAFDSILDKSYSLEDEEKDAIQQLLADASVLLGDYARINFLVDKIKKNSVNEQIIKLEAEFNDRQFNLLTVMLGLSLVAIIALIWWGVSSKRVMQEVEPELGREPEVKSSKDNVPPFSSAEDRSFEEHNDNVMSSAIKQSENDSYLAERDSRDQNFDLQPPQQPGSARQQSIQHNTEEAPMSEGYIASVTDSKPEINIEEMLDTLDGDVESVELLLGVFVQDHADDFAKFQSLLTQDEPAAARVVHSLKGVAGSIKASRLAIIAASIEMTMKQSRPISEHDLEELEKAIEASVSSALEYLDSLH